VRKPSGKALLLSASLVSASLVTAYYYLPNIVFDYYASSIPKENPTADLKVVFTGGTDRVKHALQRFSKSCTNTNQFLLISGAGASANSIINKANEKIPEECKPRILVESKAQTTAGNGLIIPETIDYIETNFYKKINTVEINTSGYHLARALNEANDALSGRDIKISAKKVGNCDDDKCFSEMRWDEGYKITARAAITLGGITSIFDPAKHMNDNGAIEPLFKTRLHRVPSGFLHQPSQP